MPNSLRSKLSSLRYKGKITEEEYKDLIRKLDGHDKALKTQWIPCTERLPDYDKYVLLTYAYDGSVFIGSRYKSVSYEPITFTTSKEICVDKWIVEFDAYIHNFDEVSAWAELPEGYKKGGDSE